MFKIPPSPLFTNRFAIGEEGRGAGILANRQLKLTASESARSDVEFESKFYLIKEYALLTSHQRCQILRTLSG